MLGEKEPSEETRENKNQTEVPIPPQTEVRNPPEGTPENKNQTEDSQPQTANGDQSQEVFDSKN